MAWPSLRDPSNPFEESGLSREVAAMLDYLAEAKRQTGVDVVVTSTTDHPTYSSSGRLSRHRAVGTDGLGLGVDFRMRTRSKVAGAHRAAYELVVPVMWRAYELIYSGERCVKAGKEYNYPRNVLDGHLDHIHWANDVGVFVVRVVPPVIERKIVVHQYVASLVAPNGGVWHLQADGGIITDTDRNGGPEAPFFGSASGALGTTRVKGLLPYKGGYAVVVQHPDEAVSYFHFPAQ